jgi:hypothetical protein
MSKPLPHHVRSSLERARDLHDRAAADYEKCLEFSTLMAKLLDQLEDGGHQREAKKVMSLLLDCSPREGVRCEKSTLVGERVKKL